MIFLLKFRNLGAKRGLSSIIGGMIFLFLLTSGVSVYFLAIESQTQLMETQEVLMDLQTKKMQENFDVAISTDENNNERLVIFVKNQGSFPMQISDFWIINKTDVVNEYPATRYFVNSTDSFIPSGYGMNILENTPLFMNQDTYDVKVISTLGTIHKKEFVVGGSNNLRADLLTIPPDVRIGENVTIALHITNIGKTKLLNVTASTPVITPSSGVTLPLPVNPTPVNLNPAESIFFDWEYTVAGIPGNTVNFIANASGIDELTGFNFTSNNASEEITLREDEGGGDLIVLTQDLLARPEIFVINPSPFGKSGNDQGVWGMNIVNPTNATMEVSKISITALPPGANSNNEFFDFQASDCDNTPIYPTTGWYCPTENQFIWKNIASPEIIPPFSAKSFLAKVEADTTGNDDLEGVIIHGSVFTTLGAFGKAGYESSQQTGSESIVNVFLSDNIDSRSNSDIKGSRIGIAPSSTEFFNVVLADMDDNTSTTLPSGTRLIINVPREWDNVSVVSHPGFNVPTVTPFADGSTQIIASTSGILGNAGNVADTVRFSAQAPSVTNDQMYVMYVLADGETSSGWAIGPLGEILLQIDVP